MAVSIEGEDDDDDVMPLIGVLGLCAIVLSSPYDIPKHVPEALMLLCEHSHDPDLIQVCLCCETK